MRTTLLAAAIAALVAAAPGAAAQECEPTTSEPELTAGGFYVDNDLCQPGCIFSVWIYCESNGMEGLQRNDDVRDDTCGGMIDSDTCGI